MKKLLKPLKVELGNCVGTQAEILEVKRYLPGSVLFQARFVEIGKPTWHIGQFAEGRVMRACAGDDDADEPGSVAQYSEGFLLRRSGSRWLKVTQQEEEELPALAGADEVWPCRDGFIRFRKGKRFGFLDRNGGAAIEPVYEEARDFCEGFAYVQVFGGGENKRLIDARGRTVLSVKAEYVSDVHGGHCLLTRIEDGEKALKAVYGVGRENREVELCKVGEAAAVCKWKGESLFPYRIGTVYGLVNVHSGHPCASCWEHAHQPSQGLCAVEYADSRRPARHMLLDGRFKRVGGVYEALKPVSCSLALAMREGRCGYVNIYGQEQIPFRYADARSFAFGTALVKEEGEAGRWMVIDAQGKTLEAEGEKLVFEDVTEVVDGPVFAVLRAQGCSYIFDHRFYGEDMLPVDEEEVICDPAAFMRTEGERLFEEEEPAWNERFRLSAPDCEAARLTLSDYALHAMRRYGLRVQRRTDGEADEVMLFRGELPPSRPPEGMDAGAADSEWLTLRIQRRMKGERRLLVVTGAASRSLRLIDDGARARMTMHDMPVMAPVWQRPLACLSEEAKRAHMTMKEAAT